MTWWEALVLGIVQGLTEFLPISSSAHISIVGQLIGSQDPGSAFTAITQLGTEAAVIVYFRHDIARILAAWSRALVGRGPRDHPDARMGWLVIIGTVPIVVLGLLFQDAIDSTLRDLRITAAMLAGFALVLGYADARARNSVPLEGLTYRDGILYGLAQSLALIPGVSRSGGTLTAGLLMGYTRAAAARYSFLLAIPAVVGSGMFKLVDAGNDPVEPAWGAIVLATVVAFGVGYAVIAWLLRYITRHSFLPFVLYRLVLAAIVVVLLAAGVVEPTELPVVVEPTEL
jgi:undecaprenyl-diphosphatase